MPTPIWILLGMIALLVAVLAGAHYLQRQVPREGDPEITPDEDCGCG